MESHPPLIALRMRDQGQEQVRKAPVPSLGPFWGFDPDALPAPVKEIRKLLEQFQFINVCFLGPSEEVQEIQRALSRLDLRNKSLSLSQP